MTPRRFHRGSLGFTLLEITVALVIGGMVVIAASALFLGLAGRDEAIQEASAHFDRIANGEQLLGTLFLNVDSRADSAGWLTGDSLGVSFVTWCRTVGTELSRCRADLRFAERGTRRVLILRLSALKRNAEQGASELELRESHRGVLRYLVDARNGGRWADRWSQRQPPAAVSAIVDGDTLLFPVGL